MPACIASWLAPQHRMSPPHPHPTPPPPLDINRSGHPTEGSISDDRLGWQSMCLIASITLIWLTALAGAGLASTDRDQLEHWQRTWAVVSGTD